MIHSMRVALAALVLILPVGVFYSALPAFALSATSSADARLRLDWEPGTAHAGRPVIRGWVYNDYGRSAKDVRLLVETLDPSGNVIARDIGFVRGTVAFNDRTYFEVPLKRIGASYRVSIVGFDWNCRG